MRINACCLFLLFGLFALAQVETVPLNNNPVLEKFHTEHPDYVWGKSRNVQKWGLGDTLKLPFFDDFSQNNLYPDSSKWQNNLVYVNSQFPINPPTINVATFDALNAIGRPYNATLNRNFRGPGDTLLSQPINTAEFKGNKLEVDDSLYFSFYYQANGNGYHLAKEDSLRLYFKSENGNWILMWSASGQSESQPFQQVMISLSDSGYLYEGFQFLFTNWTRQIGNASHWHVDYVYLDVNRSMADTFYYDYSFTSSPSSMLKRYYCMPFEHYLIDPDLEKADTVGMIANNLYNVTLQCEAQHIEIYQGDTILKTSLDSNIRNISYMEYVKRVFDEIPEYENLPASRPMVIERVFYMDEPAPSTNDIRINDIVRTTQVFDDYFAHDDGTAERGFGFDHNTNPSNIEGEIAYQFTLNKADQVYAVGIYFNEAVFDVSRREFKIRIWDSIAGIDGAMQDKLLYESEVLNPQYVYLPGRYYIHYLDTTLNLNAGKFYVGWYQSSMFNLNVGWDMNSGNSFDQGSTSPYLYYKLFGQWSNKDLPVGELMMRAYVGTPRVVWAGVDDLNQDEPVFGFYPNPASDRIILNREYELVQIFDLQGKLHTEVYSAEQVDLSTLPKGIYVIRARDEEGLLFNGKLIIFAH